MAKAKPEATETDQSAVPNSDPERMPVNIEPLAPGFDADRTPGKPVAPVLTNPGFSSIPIDTMDLGQIHFVIEAFVSALQAPDAPKSRLRSIVVTKLEEAGLWAGKAAREEV